jgi:hypothetical protein
MCIRWFDAGNHRHDILQHAQVGHEDCVVVPALSVAAGATQGDPGAGRHP